MHRRLRLVLVIFPIYDLWLLHLADNVQPSADLKKFVVDILQNVLELNDNGRDIGSGGWIAAS